MNPGSVFGSSFGQPQSSPFGTAGGSASDTPAAFGANPDFPSSGATSQVFGSANSGNTGFGTVGGGTGFGLMPGTDSRSSMFGNPGPGSSPGNVFGSPGPGVSGFGSGTSSPAFGTSISAPGFGTGTLSQNTGFGSRTTGGSTFGALSATSLASGTLDTGSGFGMSGTGSGFGGGTTASGPSSSGFGANSSAMSSSGFSTSTTGFSTGSSGFGMGSTGFATSPPGFGPTPSSSSSVGASACGISTSSGFSGGSSVFGSFISAQGTSTALSTAQTQSNPLFGGSSVFGSKTKPAGDAGQGFASSSAVSCQAGSTSTSAFGSNVSSSVFGQIPASTVAVGSATRSSVFASNIGTGGTGTSTRAVFGTVDKAVSSGTSTNTVGSVFGGAQAVSVFGAKDPSQKSSLAGNLGASGQSPPSYSAAGTFRASGLPPPSYSSSVSSGHPGMIAPSSTASVFGDVSRMSSGGGSVFGSATSTGTGEGNIFGGASKASSGGGSVFGGAFKTSSGEGSVFGGAGRSVIKQESSQPSDPQRPSAVGVSHPPPSVFGPSPPFGGKFPSQKETNPVATSTQPSSSASVFGGRTTFPSVFGGARQQQGSDNSKAETTPSVFGGKQSHEKKESVPRQPLFPTAASVGMAGSLDHSNVKQESEHRGGTFGTVTGGDRHSVRRDGPEVEGHSHRSGKSGLPVSKGADAQSTTTMSVFGGKQSSQKTEAVPSGSTFGFHTDDAGSIQGQKRNATHDETGEVDFKRGRMVEQEQADVLTTGGRSQGQPSPNRTPEKVKLRRASSLLEDISSRTSIICKGIMPSVNKGANLRNHFSRFGKVKRVMPVPSKRHAIIQFETHEAASRAKKHGTILPRQDSPLSIFWKSSASEKSPGASEDAAGQSRLPFRRPEAAEARPGKERSSQQQQLASFLPSSVAAELASMSGADSDAGTAGKFSRDQAAAGTRSAREGRSTHRRKPAQQTTSRDKTPPPAPSSSTSTLPSSSASNLGKTTNVTVSDLHKMVATTTMDKVSVLDTRDKLLRQKIGKQTSGSVHSKAFVGTCPDMCPEKERLYREEVRRLSIFEIIPGSSTMTGSTSLVNHMRAVKEYSRSSADQDEPLPIDLRPLPVLTMTMNYLLVEVANCGEDGKWADWYDFLWNRTRSIRKEITQQQLCSQEVVDLLEKCVRFHIYCAERLCTEDMMVFDSKINDENLTKCLQTLKELYADMENKHGWYCPNEAEFRAYIVLMNLNEGDTLREVQQLRHEVRASPEIGFAVKAYSALYSNNYVRFFRLVRSASFLPACVLHRYFNQIRAQALRIILKSHTAGQKKVGFALSELQRLLVFENEEEIREFCSYYGLHADVGDLLLDRSAYVEPESSLPSWRAVGLVESKRTEFVGEVINGGPLQPLNLPRPQCSFDEHGRFIGSLEGLVDSQEGEEKMKPFSVKPVVKAPQLQPSPLQQTETAAVDGAAVPAAIEVPIEVPAVSRQADEAADVNKEQQLKPSSEVLKTIARDLFFEVIDQHAREMAESVISTQQMIGQCAADVMVDVTSSVVSDLTRHISTEVVEAERARQDQLLAAERREREVRAVAEILVSVIDNCMEEQAKEIALEEIEEAEAREEEERQERCTLLVQSEVLREVTGEMVASVADEVHQVDVVARLQLLNDLQKAVELKRTAPWLAVWRKALKIRQRQKRAMLDFPCAPPMRSASQRLQNMYPDRPEHASPLIEGKAALLVNHRAQMTLLSPLESEQRSLMLTANLSLASLLKTLQRKRAWEPLNLASLLRTPLNQAVQQWPRRFINELSPQNVQWKLLVSVPGEEEEGDEEGEDNSMTGGGYTHDRVMSTLTQWLCDKFTHGDTGANNTAGSSKRTLLSQYSIEVASSAAAPPKLRVGVCVRNVPEFGRRGKGKQPTKEHSLSLTKGASAILFLLPHADTADETVWLGARLRLARMLEAKPFLPATPLALLLPCGLGTPPGSSTEEVTRRLALKEFQDQDLVSDVAVVELAVRDGQPPDVAVAAPVLQTQVSEAVKFLASKVPEPPDLKCERLGDIVEDMVNQHFFTPVLQDLKCRLDLHKLHQAPNMLIGLYNSVLDHICLALTSPTLQDISWPAPELQVSAGTREDWNSKKHLGDIYELVSSLRLPWFHYKDMSSAEWSQVCHDVWTFVNAVVKKRCDSAVGLTSRISRVLAHTCLQFENVCSLTQNEDHCTPTYVNAPWTDIIVACAEFRLQRLHNWKDEEEDVGGDLEVFFEGEDLEEFEPPASWIQGLLDTEDTESGTMEDTVEQASILHFASQPAAVAEQDTFTTTNMDSKHHHDNNDRKTGSAPSAARKEPQVPPPHKSDLPENIRSALETSEKLLLHVEEERQKAQAFQRYLEKALQGDTSPDLNLSTISPSPRTAPSVMSTPALSSAFTPSKPLSTIRQGGRSSSTPRDPSVRGANLPGRYSLEPRRLAEQRTDRFAAEGEGEGEAAGEGEKPNLSLCEGVEQFKENLQAQRYANELFEKRLQSLLES